jgi:release factor H-coupled RctB family protein
MSSSSTHALTIILNANHSKKFALVLQPSDSTKDTILREARNKFRVKTLSTVFLQGGTPLDDATLGDLDKLVWVSKGEPYNGPPADPSQSNNPAEVRIIVDKSFVDDQAIKQLKAVAGLPGVRLAVGMPDLHPGGRFPVGCAIAAGASPAWSDFASI